MFFSASLVLAATTHLFLLHMLKEERRLQKQCCHVQAQYGGDSLHWLYNIIVICV
jgi:hypothetical protein